MSITSAAGTGVVVRSAAKDSNASATVLAAQTTAAIDEVIVPNAIGTNNEGNLVASPSYVGRLIMLRHRATHASTVVINNAGSGYVVDEVLTDNGAGKTSARDARFIVTAVSGGAITGIKLHEAGDAGTPAVTVGADRGEYSVEGTATARATTASASGTGATVDLTFKDAEEVRYVNADASNTLTVHEAWIDGPATSMNWRLSYIIADAATVSGLTLVNKRNDDYSSSRRLQIGDGTASVFGWIFFGDGVSLEGSGEGNTTAGTGSSDINVRQDSRLDIGYLAGGVPVSGANLFFPGGAGTADADIGLDVDDDCDQINIYDSYIKGVLNYEIVIAGELRMNRVKIFGAVNSLFLALSTVSADDTKLKDIKDVSFEGRGLAVSGLQEKIQIGENANGQVYDGVILSNSNGFVTDGVLSVDYTGEVRNAIILPNNNVFVTIENVANELFKLVNPIWNPDRSTQGDIGFDGTTNGELQELFQLDVTAQDPAGAAVSGATVKIIEVTLNDNIPHDGVTDANGFFTVDILKESMVPSGASGITRSTGDNFSVHVNSYGDTPFFTSLPVNALDQRVVSLSADPFITEATQATAITNGSGITVTSHGEAGDTDPRPMNVIAYNAGTGGVGPTLGETITGGASGATGVVVDFEGDDVEGLLVLETRNATAWTNDETITGGTSAFSAAANTAVEGTAVDENFRWEVDANSLSMNTTYDYLAARMAQDTLTAPFTDVHIWGDSEHAAFLFNGTGGFFTNRNVVRAQGVWVHNRGGGTIDFFTADDGTQVTPPVSVNLTLTGMKDNTEVRVYAQGTSTELAGVENATGGTTDDRSVTFSLAASLVVDIRFMNQDWIVPDRNSILNFTWPTTAASIPITQVFDRNFANP
jgi:hypothetical protein